MNIHCVYSIDSHDRICFVNEHWQAFAEENNASQLNQPGVLNHSLWKYISDFTTVQIYKSLIDKVRQTQTSVSVPFRCDSPHCRRYMELELRPLKQGGIEFIGSLKKIEFRDEIPLLSAQRVMSYQKLTICGWCKKIQVGSAFEEVEEAVIKLNLFDTQALPKLSHGICPSCASELLKFTKSS